MSYQFTSDRGRRSVQRSRNIWVVTAVTLLLFFAFLLNFSFFSSTLQTIGRPIWKSQIMSSGIVGDIRSFFSSRSSLISENDSLKNQLNDLSAKAAVNDSLLSENESLKELLGRTNKKNLLLAAVIERPSQSPYDTMVVDVGSANNVSVGEQVFADSSLPIGTVTDVYGNSARVILYSSSGQKVSVLLGTKNVKAEAEGQGGGNFTIKIPRGVAIQEGDRIIAPSITTAFFGTVSHIDLAPNDSFQTIYFNSPVNLNELRFVYLIK